MTVARSREYLPVAEIPVDPDRGRVFEHGWQSWSPTTTYPVIATSCRPSQPVLQTMCWRPGRPVPREGFQGEGLLVVDPGSGGHGSEGVRVFAAGDALHEVPSIRARLVGDRLLVTADDPDHLVDLTVAGSTEEALTTWADGFARRAGTRPLLPAPTVWCSWYHYGSGVTAADVLENLTAIAGLDLPVEVIQVDDGWQSEIGDWLEPSDRFTSMADVVARIRDTGRRAGVWIAPFLVGARSRLAHDHPDWLVGGADAGHNWGQPLFGLDVTHPGAAGYLQQVFASLRSCGFDYFKLDFTYAGALSGRRHDDVTALHAYRHGLALIRAVVGSDAHLVGSGAPILPSVGLLDAMRVSPDIDASVDPVDEDLSRPSFRAAAMSVIGRAWQHGRFWVNDPDCLLARPAVPHRQRWAAIVERYGGLRGSGDRILDLDGWGLETTRRLLASVPAPTPFPSASDGAAPA